MENINTLVFSDVHLGTPTSRAYDLSNALKEYRFKKLVIVGDMFDDLNFEYLTSTHWELLKHIGKVSRRGVEVIWIEGNHDAKFCEFISHLMGIRVYKEYIWEINGRKFIALHGHQFDNFISKGHFLGRVLAVTYTRLQRMFSSHLFDFLMMKFANRWLRLAEQVTQKAIDYAKNKKADVVICGHTHFAYNIKENGVEYFNLGSWNNSPSHLLAIQDDASANHKVIA